MKTAMLTLFLLLAYTAEATEDLGMVFAAALFGLVTVLEIVVPQR